MEGLLPGLLMNFLDWDRANPLSRFRPDLEGHFMNEFEWSEVRRTVHIWTFGGLKTKRKSGVLSLLPSLLNWSYEEISPDNE